MRNKPQLGWQVKTRHEREIPMAPPLVDVLRIATGGRAAGPLFLRRRFRCGQMPSIPAATSARMDEEIRSRAAAEEQTEGTAVSRLRRSAICRQVWRDAGGIKIERLRIEYLRLCRSIDAGHLTAPKMLRHLFATGMQDANVDPLIRNELMGHSPASVHSETSLGMTAKYTHTRPETRRRQLAAALESRPALAATFRWLELRAKESEGSRPPLQVNLTEHSPE